MKEKVIVLGCNWGKDDGAIKPLLNGYTIIGNINPNLCNAYKTLSNVIKIHPLGEFNAEIKDMPIDENTNGFAGTSKEEMMETLISLSDEEIDQLFEQPMVFRSFAGCVFANTQELCERGEEGKNILKKFILKVLSPECTATDKGTVYFNEIDTALSIVLIDSTCNNEPLFDENLLTNFFSDNDTLDRGYGSNIDISKILVENRPKYDMRTILSYIHRGYHKDGSMNLEYIVNDIIENIEEYKKSMESSKNVLTLSVFKEPVSPVMLIKLHEIVKMFDGKIKLGLVVLEKSAIETEDREKVLNIISEIITNIGELAAVYYISVFAKPLIDSIKFDPMIIAKTVFQRPGNRELLYEVLEELVVSEESRYFTLRSLLTSYKGEEERKNIIKIIKRTVDLSNPKLCLDIMLYFMHELSLTDATAITLELLVGVGKEVNKRSGAELIASLMAHPEVTTIEQSKAIYNTLIELHR